jgi:thiamine-phosphate pyrophosphorylase
MKELNDCRLYAFIDTAYLGSKPAAELARQLRDGGADLVQLRAKNKPLDEVRRLAEEVAPVLREGDVGFVVNDYVDVAREFVADFCHLGQEDFISLGHSTVAPLRKVAHGLGIGLSTHGPVEAEAAVLAGADYLGVGPVFPTGTKPEARPVTLEYVRWAAGNLQIPWFAIGGINLQNLDEVLEAGARRICAVSAIMNARDVTQTCRDFKKRLETA